MPALDIVAVTVAVLLLLSHLAPTFYRRRFGVPAPGGLRLSLVSLLWLVPVSCFALTRKLPDDFRWGAPLYDISSLFREDWKRWYRHELEEQRFPGGPWEPISRELLSRPGRIGGVDRLEKLLWRAAGRGDREREVWFAVAAWCAERASALARANGAPRPCAVRLIRKSFSPLEVTTPRMAFSADGGEEGWKDPQVLSVYRLDQRCG
jgi:hypothetical protein